MLMNIDSKKVRLKEKETIHLHTSPDDTLLDGRFEVLELIGEGGSGLVYKVKDLKDGSIYALKLLKLDFQSDKTALKRFKQEAKNLSKVSHENLVTVIDHGLMENGTPFILMEYFESLQLKEMILESERGLTLEETLEIFIDVLKGVEAIHANGIVHRDITAKNILLQKDGDRYKVKLVDFGIAKSLPSASSTTQGFTETGKVFGTPDYMSPEQCMSKPVDEASDIYSLGCCFYEALAGKPPFKGLNAIETMLKHTEEKTPRLKKSIDSLSKVNRIITRAMAKNPKHRFSSARDLRTNFEKLKHGTLSIGPLSYAEKMVSISLVSIIILGFTGYKLWDNGKVMRVLNRQDRQRQAMERIGITDDYISLPPAGLQEKVDKLVSEARDTGMKIENPWIKLSDYSKNSQAAFRKYDAIAKSIYELGPAAVPYMMQYVNDDVGMVRRLCGDTVKNRHTFPTNKLVNEMMSHEGSYYTSSLKLLAQGGSDSVKYLLAKVKTGNTEQKEKAISLVAAIILNTKTDVNLSKTSRQILLDELENRNLKNVYLIPSILITVDKESFETMQVLEKHLITDSDELVRETCASSLGVYLYQPAAIGSKETIETLKKSVREDQSPRVRLASLANLSALADRLEGLDDFFEECAKDEDLQIQYAADIGRAVGNVASMPVSHLTRQEAKEVLSDANSLGIVRYSQIERLVAYSEHQAGYFGNLSEEKRGLLLPLMIRRAVGQSNYPYVRKDYRSEFVALQSWLFNSAYQNRLTSGAHKPIINYVYFANTIKYKKVYKDPVYY